MARPDFFRLRKTFPSGRGLLAIGPLVLLADASRNCPKDDGVSLLGVEGGRLEGVGLQPCALTALETHARTDSCASDDGCHDLRCST